MDTRRLRHFISVYECGSIGQAAERLLLTQPALSKSIRHLERELDAQLFERTPLGMVPTHYGEALAHHARVIQAEIRKAEYEIGRLRGVAEGELSVGIGPSIATNLMPAATVRLVEANPEVRMTVTEGLVDDLIPALRRGELDMVIGAWPILQEPEFATETILTDRVAVYAGENHPLVTKKDTNFADLSEAAWALPPDTQHWRQRMEDIFIAQGLSAPEPMIVTNSGSFLRYLTATGRFLSFLPEQLIALDLKQGTLHRLPTPLGFEAKISLSYRANRPLTPAGQALIQAINQVVSDLGV